MKDKKLKIQLAQLWSALVAASVKSAMQGKLLPLSQCALYFDQLTGLRATSLNDFLPGLTIPVARPLTPTAKDHIDDLSDEEKVLLSEMLEACLKRLSFI